MGTKIDRPPPFSLLHFAPSHKLHFSITHFTIILFTSKISFLYFAPLYKLLPSHKREKYQRTSLNSPQQVILSLTHTRIFFFPLKNQHPALGSSPFSIGHLITFPFTLVHTSLFLLPLKYQLSPLCSSLQVLFFYHTLHYSSIHP